VVTTRPAWFPDWQDQAVAIIASGPTAKKAPIALLRDRLRVIAIKENVELCPFADVVYGCDAPYWRAKLGLQAFQGLKVAYAQALRGRFPDIQLIDIDKKNDRILTGTPGLLGSGGNSGFQAINLAVQFGCRRILLIGFDMHDRGGVHWYGRAYGQGRSNPGEHNFRRWRLAFEAAAADLRALDVEVVNASPASDLACFPKMTVERTLEEWRL